MGGGGGVGAMILKVKGERGKRRKTGRPEQGGRGGVKGGSDKLISGLFSCSCSECHTVKTSEERGGKEEERERGEEVITCSSLCLA